MPIRNERTEEDFKWLLKYLNKDQNYFYRTDVRTTLKIFKKDTNYYKWSQEYLIFHIFSNTEENLGV